MWGATIRKKRNALDRIWLPPNRVFGAQSLVGMSQSARKRAVRKLLGRLLRQDLFKLGLTRTEVFRAAYGFADTRYEQAVTAANEQWRQERAKYRIGQRLQPCRSCAGPEAFDVCKGRRIMENLEGAHLRGECVFCRTCVEAAPHLRFADQHVTDPYACDGSGVKPARSARVRQGSGAL